MNNIDSSWYPLFTWLRENGRQALNTETGGGNVDSCVAYLSQQIDYQVINSDGQSPKRAMVDPRVLTCCAPVLLGYIGWAAGSFPTDYVLSEVSSYNSTGWNDTLTVSSALSPMTNKLVSSTTVTINQPVSSGHLHSTNMHWHTLCVLFVLFQTIEMVY
jgi:endoglucanase